MSEKRNKEYVCWLMDKYLSNVIDAWTFCGLFHDSYDVNMDLNTLSSLEEELFNRLSDFAGRYSPFEDDLEKYPGAFYTEKELRDEVMRVKDVLCRTR